MIYNWKANYEDGTELRQFNDENESKFSDIDQGILVSFEIRDDNNKVMVDLNNGTFHVNNNHFEIQDFSNLDYEYRLIYFRRVKKVISTAGEELDSLVTSYIGYQVTIDGVNHVRMLACNGDKIIIVNRK